MASDWKIINENLCFGFFENFDDAFFGGFAVVVNVEGFSHVRCDAVKDWGWRNFYA